MKVYQKLASKFSKQERNPIQSWRDYTQGYLAACQQLKDQKCEHSQGCTCIASGDDAIEYLMRDVPKRVKKK